MEFRIEQESCRRHERRKGLGLALGYPAYVTDIDVDHNMIRVGPNEELYSQTLQAENMNYISGIPLNSPRKAAVKIRYSSSPVPAWVAPLDDGNRIRVDFEIPQRAITSGQAAVIYDGDEVIGGGTIYSSSRS